MGDPVLLLLRIDVGLGSFDAKAGIFSILPGAAGPNANLQPVRKP
jgi:hypothetical protein